MKDVICITNQKGGVGKSTTANQVAAYLSLEGYKTLLIDFDGQGSLTLARGFNADESNTLFEVLSKDEKLPISDAIQRIDDNLFFIPANGKLSMLDSVLPQIGRYTQLKKALKTIENAFDYVVIDTPPALGDLTLNALMASTKVIVAAQATLYSLDAVQKLASTIEAVKEENEALEIIGVLLTRYTKNSIISRELTELYESTCIALNTKLYKTRIRECVAIGESEAFHKDIFTYKTERKNAQKDYRAFCEELMQDLNK